MCSVLPHYMCLVQFISNDDMSLVVQGPDNDEKKEEGRKDYSANACFISSDLVEGGWPFFPTMHSVMEAIKATSPDGGTKSRRSPEYTCKCLFCVHMCIDTAYALATGVSNESCFKHNKDSV